MRRVFHLKPAGSDWLITARQTTSRGRGEQLEDAWQKTIKDLKAELPAGVYEPLIRSARPLGFATAEHPDVFLLRVDDSSFLGQLKPAHRIAIQDRLTHHCGRKVSLVLEPPGSDAEQSQGAALPRWLNRGYRFDRFITDPGNRLALLAFESCATAPGRTNPLVVYGDSGTGKSHLMHGLASALMQSRGLSVFYATFEDFRDDFARAMQSKRTLDFKDHVRSYDVLMLEHAQLLAVTTPAIQEEFFHLFNTYQERGDQVVLSLDRPAGTLTLPAHLQSRLLGGLQVSLQRPGAALRLKYLSRSAAELGLRLTEDVIGDLSARIGGSLRELDSVLSRLTLLAAGGAALNDVKELRAQLRDLVPGTQGLHISLDRIVQVVCQKYGITRDQILSSSRRAEFTLPRHIAMHMGIQFSSLNKSAIARYFRKSDHTTVINAERNIERRLRTEAGFAQIFDEIVEELRASGA